MRLAPIKLIIQKEWKESFNSPMPYVFLGVFFLLQGWFFTYPLFLMGQATLEEFFAPLPVVLAIFLPAMAMRMFAEEYKMGTVETLATLPLRDAEIVLGKYGAVIVIWLAALGLSLFYPLVLLILGRPDFGQVAAGYLGAFQLGALYAAAGLFASSLTRSQVIGVLLGFIFCFALFLFGKVTQFQAGPALVISYLGVDSHYASFLRGVVDTRDLVYFLSGILLFLAGTLASFNSRRWR
jgi:ABC-2 type transport system permease protein